MAYLTIFAPLATAILAAVLVTIGNYWLQQRVNRRNQAAEELKRRLYEYLEFITEYWISKDFSGQSKDALEAKMIAYGHFISFECDELGKMSRKLCNWHRETREDRLQLMDAATGGCFQCLERDWQEDPQRASQAAQAVMHIIRALNQATTIFA